jgi:hypothetical protein
MPTVKRNFNPTPECRRPCTSMLTKEQLKETFAPGLRPNDLEKLPSLTNRERLILANIIKCSNKELEATKKKQKEILKMIRDMKNEKMLCGKCTYCNKQLLTQVGQICEKCKKK